MDLSTIAPSGEFSAKAWVNTALAGAAASSETAAAPTLLTTHLSILLTKLQLSAADVNDEVGRRCDELAGMAPTVSRELCIVREQAGAVRAELCTLLEEVAALEERSEASVATLRGALRLRERFAAAVRTLQQAEDVVNLLRSVEASFARNEPTASASAVVQLGGALEALDPTQLARLFPDAPAKLKELQAQVLDRLQPELLQAVREHDNVAVHRLRGLFVGLQSAAAVRECYVQCQQGPIFECWNLARRSGQPAEALRALWRCLEETVPKERAWVATVFPDDASLLPAVLAEALEAVGPQMSDLLAAPLDAHGAAVADGADASAPAAAAPAAAAPAADEMSPAISPATASLLGLGALWAEALRRVGRLAADLGGLDAPGVRRITDALLLPFEPTQRRYARSLRHLFTARLPPVPSFPKDSVRRVVAHAATALERSTAPFMGVLQTAWTAALDFGGPLGAAGAAALLCDLTEAHAAALATALPPLRPKAPGAAKRAPGALPAVTPAMDGTASAEAAHDALTLLRAVHGMREKLMRAEAAFDKALGQTASACTSAPLHTDAQRAAAAELESALHAPPAKGDELPGGLGLLRRARAAAGQLLATAQQLALEAICAPIGAAISSIHAAALIEVWRGHGALHGSSVGGDSEAIAAAMLAFSATPQSYITHAGEVLLAIPQQLEPFALDTTLTRLPAVLRRPSAPVAAAGEAQEADEDGLGSLGELDGASEWLEAVGAHTVSLLLEAVRDLEQLSLLGAKQLAADVQYVDNILSAGLGLPADPRLTELVTVLTADVAALPELVTSSKALPEGFAASVQAKRAR